MMEIAKLIESEIGDFFAGFGHPGEPETPEEMQSQLLARVMPLLAGLKQEPVAYYFPGGEREIEQVSLPDDIDDGQKANCIPLYAAPQLPQPAVVMTFDEWSRKCDLQLELCDSDLREKARYIWDEACRSAMLQGKAELPAYEIKRFGEFGANGLTRDDGELAISIHLFNFERGTTPELERGAIVEKYALQAIINALQQQCDRLSDAPMPVIWPAAPQQEVDNG